MSNIIPPVLQRVRDFVTFKVYTVGPLGRWHEDGEASGPDLGELISAWQQESKAQIYQTEAPRASPHREGPDKFRVILTTFVYYVPATEGTHDPERAPSKSVG